MYTTEEEDEDSSCPLCKEEVTEDQDGVYCETCLTWAHKTCLNLSDEEFAIVLNNSETPWFCARCMAIKANNIKWGEYEGEDEISNIIKTTYNTTLNWGKIFFSLHVVTVEQSLSRN